MRDAAARGHQVHGAGLDFLDVALAVAMHDRTVEQPGDGGEPDVRMRPHVHALAGDELHRPEMIEEDERTNHLPLAMRQRAAHLEPVAEVAGARHDDKLQRVAGSGIAEHGIVGGKPAHGRAPSEFWLSYQQISVSSPRRRGPILRIVSVDGTTRSTSMLTPKQNIRDTA